MKGQRLVLKARSDLNRLISSQTPIEDEPDSEVKAGFILTTLKNDPSNDQNKPKPRTDPTVRAGGKLTTDRRDALQALKIACWSELEEEDAIEEDSPPKPQRPMRPYHAPVYQENVQPQPHVQPRVAVHRHHVPAPQPQPLFPRFPRNRVYGTGARVMPPPPAHPAPQPFDFSSLVAAIAMNHAPQPQYFANPYYPIAGPQVAYAPPPQLPPPPHLPPLEIVAMAEQLQMHIAQYMQIHNVYPAGMVAPFPMAPLPPVLPSPSPGTSMAMAIELQQHIARFLQAHNSYMYHIRAPEMPCPLPMPYNWRPTTDPTEKTVNDGKSSATNSCNAPSFEATKVLVDNKKSAISEGFKSKNSAFTSAGRAFGKTLSLNEGGTTKNEDGGGGRRQSQRQIKKPARNTDAAFEFKENKMKGDLTLQKNWHWVRSQPSQEVKRGLAAAVAPAAVAAAALVPKKPAPKKPVPVPPAQQVQKPNSIKPLITTTTTTSAPNNSLANDANDSLEAQIKRKTITAVNAHYYKEMPADIQAMEKEVLDFSKPYTPSGASYFTPAIKNLKGAAMYAAQLAVIEERLAWVMEEMKKDGTVYGWKKGKEPDSGSYEFYRGIALKYLRDRLKSRCRVEAGKRDKDK